MKQPCMVSGLFFSDPDMWICIKGHTNSKPKAAREPQQYFSLLAAASSTASPFALYQQVALLLSHFIFVTSSSAYIRYRSYYCVRDQTTWKIRHKVSVKTVQNYPIFWRNITRIIVCYYKISINLLLIAFVHLILICWDSSDDVRDKCSFNLHINNSWTDLNSLTLCARHTCQSKSKTVRDTFVLNMWKKYSMPNPSVVLLKPLTFSR
jgi:hypothetical protein